MDEGKHYFLSRPRRFGKSLFLDTLKELFEGNEALFEGLHIHDRWDWSVRHPVVRLDFGSGHFQEPGHLHKEVIAQLDGFERDAAVSVRYDTTPGPLPSSAPGPACTDGAAGRGAGRRVQQAHSRRAGDAGHRPRQPRLSARTLRSHQDQRRPT